VVAFVPLLIVFGVLFALLMLAISSLLRAIHLRRKSQQGA